MADLGRKLGYLMTPNLLCFLLYPDAAKKLLSLEGPRQSLVRNIGQGILDQLS